MKKLFQEIEKCLKQGEDFVLVTVIADSGSTPRGAGARMLIRKDGTFAGTIGGGNVEYKSQQIGLQVLNDKVSFFKGFKLDRSQVADLGMICGGDVVVYFQYINSENENLIKVCDVISNLLEKDEDSYIITEITDETAWNMGVYSKSTGLIGMDVESLDSLLKNRACQVVLGDRKFYSEPLVKSGSVYVFGGGHVAQELVPVISHLGFRTILFDDRKEFANASVFPTADEIVLGDFLHIFESVTINENDYVVIMSRGHEYDYKIQQQVLSTKAHYMGVMGSQRKMKTISEKLQADGFDKDAIKRFKSPIGLEIEAETPAEIAISIAGELIQIRASRKRKENE